MTAELVAYSGFSATNYLEQPYNPDLDFGTGDFCVMGWATASAASDWLLDRKTPGDNASVGFDLYQSDGDTNGGNLRFGTRSSIGGTLTTTDVGEVTSKFTYFAVARKGGVVSTYINGTITGSNTNTTDLTNISANTFIGLRSNLSAQYLNGSLALIRIGATAPSPDQIRKIYNDEKALFQPNAACTLFGTSDAVTALAHDEITGLDHAGTSAGRSDFSGLIRVGNTTTPVTTAIAANNSLILEQ